MTGGGTRNRAIYATVWRWHFYAGLFVIPFILLLAVTGAAYLFKPQVERWEERAFHGLPVVGSVSPQRQVDAALAAFPGSRLDSYRLPERAGDAAMVHLAMPDKRAMPDVFVSPRGAVLGSIAPDTRLMEWVKRIHGQLLLGKRGAWLVELAASWAFVLVLSGLYLWWPRGRGFRAVLWPRFGDGRSLSWRDLHVVTGFWVSGLALLLLITALPWTGVWGNVFKTVRTEAGWIRGPQDWTLGGEAPVDGGDPHAGHDRAARIQAMPMPAAAPQNVGLNAIVAKASSERLAFPVTVTPPDVSDASGVMAWTVRSDAQNRPLRTTITYDMATGRETARESFADEHVIDRIVGYGIAWHEGQLFGWVNQLVGVFTAIGLMFMAISGYVQWRRRKPDGALGAPPSANVPARIGAVVVIMLVLAALLPLLAISLATLWLFERLALPHLPQISRWLGVPSRGAVGAVLNDSPEPTPAIAVKLVQGSRE